MRLTEADLPHGSKKYVLVDRLGSLVVTQQNCPFFVGTKQKNRVANANRVKKRESGKNQTREQRQKTLDVKQRATNKT